MTLFVSWELVKDRITIKTFEFSSISPPFFEPPFFHHNKMSSAPLYALFHFSCKDLCFTTTSSTSLRDSVASPLSKCFRHR